MAFMMERKAYAPSAARAELLELLDSTRAGCAAAFALA